MKPAIKTDRLPPFSLEAEEGVLGCLLKSPNEGVAQFIESFGVASEKAFYDLRHQTIYQHLIALNINLKPIDLITVQQSLKDAQLLEQVGGLTYLAQLEDAVPSAANLGYYIEILREKYLLRETIKVCTDAVGRIYDFDGDVDGLLDEVERDILKVNQDRVSGGTKPTPKLVRAALDKMEDYFNRKGEIGGIKTGFTDLDKMTDGLHGGEMIVIAARPSMGKTSLAMNIVEHIAINQALPVGVFSLEMSAESLIFRTLCSLARVNLRDVREGEMSQADFSKVSTASSILAKAPIYIDDTAGLSILQFRARARRMVQQHGIKAFVVDYLQLLHGTSKKAQENRQQEIAEISSGIKALAKELNVPIIVLAQLNRDIEKQAGRKPRLSDLRESGSIEQDADLVGLLHKPEPKEGEDSEDENAAISVNLLVAKQRNGPTGDVYLTFLKPYTRFESAARIHQSDIPNHHND